MDRAGRIRRGNRSTGFGDRDALYRGRSAPAPSMPDPHSAMRHLDLAGARNFRQLVEGTPGPGSGPVLCKEVAAWSNFNSEIKEAKAFMMRASFGSAACARRLVGYLTSGFMMAPTLAKVSASLGDSCSAKTYV